MIRWWGVLRGVGDFLQSVVKLIKKLRFNKTIEIKSDQSLEP